MPFVRKIDHPGEIEDTNVPGSCLKTVPDVLVENNSGKILAKSRHIFHFELKKVPKILLDQIPIGLDFNLSVFPKCEEKKLIIFETQLKSNFHIRAYFHQQLEAFVRIDSLRTPFHSGGLHKFHFLQTANC